MDLNEISILTSHEAVEAVSNILMELNASGLQIKDKNDYEVLKKGPSWGQYGLTSDETDFDMDINEAVISAYFTVDEDIESIMTKVHEKVAELSNFGLNPGKNQVTKNLVKEEDWSTSWEKYYKPERITRYLTIVPVWEDYEEINYNELIIKLDPGMAFGTGTHPTTILALRALESYMRGNETVYDVGTGSGVLSIAASLMGAKSISAYDLDQIAVNSAAKNIALNPKVDNVEIASNNLLAGIDSKVDIVVANILAEIIEPLVPQANHVLNSGGLFITSGIIADKLEKIEQILNDNDFDIVEELSMKDWRSIIAVKR
ncbi:50S ribosomal protein L11 methyltransferase [Lactobacillus sp. S2-2]|uniref:50S ribosomal protein L11 methyltransferase n=1 Tax=Lactobacillus sp. S2-2 TaxID=2692917 RepID=UPI001F030033|nr:50S ribosomal protein L11 methyltransferase [Lactobacillus sp. S2-2]MCF6514964.1 50S ribosomal protein L11 methyltransferase [Lactobacillus sp. S2-2]